MASAKGGEPEYRMEDITDAMKEYRNRFRSWLKLIKRNYRIPERIDGYVEYIEREIDMLNEFITASQGEYDELDDFERVNINDILEDIYSSVNEANDVIRTLGFDNLNTSINGFESAIDYGYEDNTDAGDIYNDGGD